MKFKCTHTLIVFYLVVVAGCRGVELDRYQGLRVEVATEAGVAKVAAVFSRSADTCSGNASALTATINGESAAVGLEDQYSGGLFPSLFPDGCGITATATIPYEDDGQTVDVDLVVASNDVNEASLEASILRGLRHTFVAPTSAFTDAVLGTSADFTINPPFDDDVTTATVTTTRVSGDVQETGGLAVVVNSPTTFGVHPGRTVAGRHHG